MTDLRGDNSKVQLAEALNQLLADSFALFLKTKNFHWHVSGPHFRDYHLLFDEHALEIMGMTDRIAERVRKLGQPTLRSIGDIARRQTIGDNDAASVPAAEMLTELRDDNRTFVATLKSLKDLCESAGDNATDGMVDDWTDQTEQRIWFLNQTMGE